MLIDLRRINLSLKIDYLNTIFLKLNMMDTLKHFAGKKLFTKLDCRKHTILCNWQMVSRFNFWLIIFHHVLLTISF